MDRGGRGRGGSGSGSSGQGSSLPRTLHGSLLQPGSQEPAAVLHEEPQPMTEAESAHQGDIPYAAHPSRSARTASLHPPSLAPPAFEEGSSRDLGSGLPRSHTTSFERALPLGPGRLQDPHPYLPPIQIRPSASSSTDPVRYASALPGSTGYYSYPPPTPSRLPSVRSVDSEAQPGPSTGDPRYHTYPPQDVRMWGPSPVDRATQLQQQNLLWGGTASYVQDAAEFQRMYGEVMQSARGWMQGARQEEIPSDDSRNTAAHLSAARSTIWPEQSFTTSAPRETHYAYPIPQAGPSSQPSRATHEQSAYLPPFYPAEQYPPTQPQPPPPYTQASRVPGPSDYRDTHLGLSDLDPAGPSYRPPPQLPRYPYGPDPGTSSEYQHPQQQLHDVQEESSAPDTPVPSHAGAPVASSSRKRKARDSDDDEDESARPRKITRKTQIACYFCRGRKLKCDGQLPMCGNCQKRNNPCSYAPFPKRRGPGKAPKGQKKLAALKAKSAQGSQTGSAPPGGSASQTELRSRPSTETLPRYTLLPSSSETHLPQMGGARFEHLPPQPQHSHEPAPAAGGYPQQYQYPTSTDPGMGAGRLESPQMQYPESATPAHQQTYGRPYDTQRPASGLSQHLQYPLPQEHPHVSGPGTPETWGSAPQATTTGLMPGSTARPEPHEEGGSTELPHDFFYDERHPPPRPGLGGGPQPGQTPPQ